MTPYDWLAFAKAALPVIGITAFLTLVVVLLVKRGPDGQAVLVEVALRIIDWLLPKRAAAKQRKYERMAEAVRRRNLWQ